MNLEKRLETLYAAADLSTQKMRYEALQKGFIDTFDCEPTHFFSAPGRSEICGNHTDHNHGKVMACAIDLDAVAVAKATDDSIITIASDKYPTDVIDINDLEVRDAEKGKSISLLRGVVAKFKEAGLTVGGFIAYTSSNVLGGSGLSSSAAYEVLLCAILRGLFENEAPDAVTAAIYSQYAENVYFGKPCGLMDQMACSVGGFVQIDFKDPSAPVISPIPFDFAKTGHRLIITDCKADHADATADYAAIREDMAAVSAFFGKRVLREVDPDDFYNNITAIREKVGDMPLLRAMHFFEENKTVERAAAALQAGDFEAFKKEIITSGRSSYMYLQNIYSANSPRHQALSLALCRSEQILKGKGAWRVHGGGFGGTIQAFVPEELVTTYTNAMEALFGKGCCYLLNVRPKGGVML